MLKILSKIDVGGMFYNTSIGIHKNSNAISILNGENKEAFLLKCPLSPLLVNIVLEVLPRAIMQEEEIKEFQTGHNEPTFSVCRWHDSIHRIVIYRRLIQHTTGTNKWAWKASREHKLNEHKLTALVFTNNSIAEKEPASTVPFKIAEKKLIYPGINLTRDVTDLYDENH